MLRVSVGVVGQYFREFLHFGVFCPFGVVLAVDLQWEQGEIGESFIELSAENVCAEGVENPVSAVVAGVYSG